MKQQLKSLAKTIHTYLCRFMDFYFGIDPPDKQSNDVYATCTEVEGWVNPYLQYQYVGKPAFKFTYNRF
jgi:hypothetical protein